jgi:hypothetical protein
LWFALLLAIALSFVSVECSVAKPPAAWALSPQEVYLFMSGKIGDLVQIGIWIIVGLAALYFAFRPRNKY